MFLINNILRVQSGIQASDDEIIRIEYNCVQGGINDLLAIENVNDRIQLESISSASLLKYIEYLLINNNAIKFCLYCGNSLSEGAKFCCQCGEKLI